MSDKLSPPQQLSRSHRPVELRAKERRVAGAFVYDPSAVLGEGTSGRAYRGRDVQTDTVVAVKIFLVDRVRLEEQQERRQRGPFSPELAPAPSPSPQSPVSSFASPLSPSSAFPAVTRSIAPDEVSILYWLQRARCANLVHLYAAFFHDPEHRRRRLRERQKAQAESSAAASSGTAASSPPPTARSADARCDAETVKTNGNDDNEDEQDDNDEPATESTTAMFVVVTEYCEGGDLRAFLRRRGPQPVWLVRAWLYQMLNALVVLHHAGVLHRDIKPDNVLLTAHRAAPQVTTLPGRSPLLRPDTSPAGAPFATGSPWLPPQSVPAAALPVGVAPPQTSSSTLCISAEEARLCAWTVKLADFGTASRIRAADRRRTYNNAAAAADGHIWACDDPSRSGRSGSLLYLAPERLVKAPYHESSDLYSIGVVLLEMLNGGTLRDWYGEAALCEGVLAAVAAPAVLAQWQQTMAANLPTTTTATVAMRFADHVGDLLVKMLEKDPTRRLSVSEALEHPLFGPTATTTIPPDSDVAATLGGTDCALPPLPPLTLPPLRPPAPLSSSPPSVAVSPSLSPTTTQPTPFSVWSSSRPLWPSASDRPLSSSCVVRSLPPSSALLPQSVPPATQASPQSAPARAAAPMSPLCITLPASSPPFDAAPQSMPPAALTRSPLHLPTAAPSPPAAQRVTPWMIAAATRRYVSTLLTYGLALSVQVDGSRAALAQDPTRLTTTLPTGTTAAVLAYATSLLDAGRRGFYAHLALTPSRCLDLADAHNDDRKSTGADSAHARAELWFDQALSTLAWLRTRHRCGEPVPVEKDAVRQPLVRLVVDALVCSSEAESRHPASAADCDSPPSTHTVRDRHRHGLALLRVLLQVAVLTDAEAETFALFPRQTHVVSHTGGVCAQTTTHHLPLDDLFASCPTQRDQLARVARAVAHRLGTLT